MRLDTIFNWTLLLPLSTALSISSHLSTQTILQCSTLYNTSSPSTPLPTLIASVALTTELSPVILHNYTTSTVTRTPKPFETLFSVLATKTKTVEKQAVNGTLGVEVTKFGTKTFWHHVTTTRTVTRERLLTSRTTVWVEAPTGFVGVRDAASASASAAQAAQNPQTTSSISRHVRREQPQGLASTSSKKTPLQKPTKGRYAVGVECQQHIRIHTTETLLLTASKMATVTAKQETRYTNRTVYGTITSTILANSSSSTSTPTQSSLEPSSAPVSGYGYSISSTGSSSPSSSSLTPKRQVKSTPPPIPSPTPPPSPSPLDNTHTIVTNTTTVTKTPYTITFTWTSTATSTSTQTLHATTTLTSHAACATGNLLGQTSRNRRINGVSLPQGLSAEIVGVESMQTETAGLCCEECVTRHQRCLWSIWEASGRYLGSCYLVLLNDPSAKESKDTMMQPKSGNEKKEARDATAAAGQKDAGSVCQKQQQKGTFGYSGKNGEVRYVVGNGLCGLLSEA